MKRGFSLLTAIIFVVVLATLAALALSMSTQSVKETNDVYLKAQAELLAKSATEYAIMAITAHERNATNGCLNEIHASHRVNGEDWFNIDIEFRYFRDNTADATIVPCNTFAEDVATLQSHYLVQIDTTVTTSADISTEPIRYFRRTIQRP